MPRIPPSLLAQARNISPNLHLLLLATRDLESARNELRWIKDYVASTARQHAKSSIAIRKPSQSGSLEPQLSRLCRERSRGVPLQYVLGSQPFGHLDIQCERGILAPRPDTEAWALHLGALMRRDEPAGVSNAQTKPLRIIDFCTGTGCIALSLFHSVQNITRKVQVKGVDISPQAITLARRNLQANVQSGTLIIPSKEHDITFERASVFDDQAMQKLAGAGQVTSTSDSGRMGGWDVLVSNPPYISRDVWANGRGQLSHSVRKYEPRLALVPNDSLPTYPGVQHQDVFYRRLLDVAQLLETRIVLFEIGDDAQAERVASMALLWKGLRGAQVEIWRDWPDATPAADEAEFVAINTPSSGRVKVTVKGSGNMRCVLVTGEASATEPV